MKTYEKKTAPMEFKIVEQVGQEQKEYVFSVRRKTRAEMAGFGELMEGFNAQVETDVKAGKNRILATADSNLALLTYLFNDGSSGYTEAKIRTILENSLDPGTIADLATDVVVGLFIGSRS